MLATSYNRILFVFSDPGGAKPCLAMIDSLEERDVTAISDRVYPFYSVFDTRVELFNGTPSDFLRTRDFDLIFTGTSYTSTLERDFIKLAKEKSITCWSFVDHWTNIKGRFINDLGDLILPNKICVIDERAKAIAVSEGIDQESILVSGNPYHTWLNRWQPKITKEEFYKVMGLPSNKKLVVLAFDPLSNINGKKLFGFDEVSVLQDLSNMSPEILKDYFDWIFLIKPHPNQNVERLLTYVGKNPLFKIVPKEADSNDIIFFSDLIIGFFSSFLLEAQIMNKSVIRLLPNDIDNDPFAEMNVGTIVNLNSLVKKIEEELHGNY